MAISLTQEKSFKGHRTPHPESPLWFEDPPDFDKGDDRAPERSREVFGDYLVLRESVYFKTFPPPEVREALKAKGKPVLPIVVEQYYVHVLDVRYLKARTFKVYKHQSKFLYTDSLDFEHEFARASPASRERSDVLDTFVRIFKLKDRTEASTLLSRWTCGH